MDEDAREQEPEAALDASSARIPAGATPPPDEPRGEPATPYRRAARYDGRWAEQDAGWAYQGIKRDLRHARLETELSVFRLQLGNRLGGAADLDWYVAVIGEPPDEALDARLDAQLAGGTEIELPAAVLAMLQERRERSTRLAPWVERRRGKLTKAELYQRPEGEEERGPPRRQR